MASVEIDFVVPDVLAAFETYSKVFGAEAVEKSSLEREAPPRNPQRADQFEAAHLSSENTDL
jgi:hypothetical protein